MPRTRSSRHDDPLATSGSIRVRPRTDEDLDACTEMAAAVHRLDGYPPYLPDGDLRALFTRPAALAAYVALVDEHVVGHVGLHPSGPCEAVELASAALGCGPTQLGIVARLLTAPASRRTGIGRALLQTAASAARERGLIPVLDVWVELTGAIALYEATGWRKLGSVETQLPDGRTLREHVFSEPV
jgi:GNAT superfamily N-acetyltransferase